MSTAWYSPGGAGVVAAVAAPAEPSSDGPARVEVALRVPVGVDSRGLREDVASHDRGVGRHVLAAEGLHHLRNGAEPRLVHASATVRVVVEGGYHLEALGSCVEAHIEELVGHGDAAR